VRKFSRRTTIFMVATGVLLTASLAFAGLLVSGESNPFGGTVEGDVSPGILKVTATPKEPPVTFGADSDPNGEPIKVTVENPNAYEVALGRPGDTPPVPAVRLKVVPSAGSEDCDENDFDFIGPDWEDVTLQPNDEAPGGPDTKSADFTLKLKDDPASIEDCSGATLTFSVIVTGDGPEVGGGSGPSAGLEGSADL